MKSSEGQLLIQEEIAKASAKLAKDLEAKEAELVKAAEELNVFREEKKARIKDSYTNLVKSLTYIAEDEQETVVSELMKASAGDAFDVKVLITQLEKAQEELTKAKADFVSEEDGIEIIEEQIDVTKSVFSGVDAEIEARFGNKQYQ